MSKIWIGHHAPIGWTEIILEGRLEEVELLLGDAPYLQGVQEILLAHLPEDFPVPWRYTLLRACRRALPLGGSLWSLIPLPPGSAALCGLTEETVENTPAQQAGWHLTTPDRRRTKNDLPLVTLIIPSYKPQWFAEALASAQAQTWPNLEIFVSDDCLSDEIFQIVQRLAGSDPRVRYVQNFPQKGLYNHITPVLEAQGEYIKYLYDDDRLHPEAVSRMAHCLMAFPEVTLVAAHRRVILSDGKPLPPRVPFYPMLTDDAIIDGPSVIALTTATHSWLVGEPSFYMFRKKDIENTPLHLMAYAGQQAVAQSDIEQCCTLLSKGDLCWLAAHLGDFRANPAQSIQETGYENQSLKAYSQHDAKVQATGLRIPSLSLLPRRVRYLGADRPWWGPLERQYYQTKQWEILSSLHPLEPRILHWAALAAEARQEGVVAARIATRAGGNYLDNACLVGRVLHRLGKTTEGNDLVQAVVTESHLCLPLWRSPQTPPCDPPIQMVIWLPLEPCTLSLSLLFENEQRQENIGLSVRLGRLVGQVVLPPHQRVLRMTMQTPEQPWIELWVEQVSGPPLQAAEIKIGMPVFTPLPPT